MAPPPSQNTLGVCNQITLLIHYYITSRLVSLLKVTDAPIHVFYKFLKFSFKIFLLFAPKMPASFRSYIF